MTARQDRLGQLIEAYVAGQTADVPQELLAEFQQAVAAHGALRALLDETPAFAATTHDPGSPPDVAEQYEILREVGRGGMGVVYLARQRSLNRNVALKVLRPGAQSYGPLLRRFLDEAQHLAQLRHPNIVSIHEVGDARGEPYFTMDYIEGEPLSATITRGPLPPSRAVEVLKQVAAAIQHAHRQGVIHRDLKPANVLIDRAGQAFVTDFGLARNVSQESNLTQSGELLGTPQYMAPEQARGQTSLVGEATDIHALGLLLFEMLCGRAAFEANSPADVLVKLLNEDPPPLRSLDRRITRDLETICMKALQKAPAARYANVSALLEDLRRYESGEPLAARRPSHAARAARWCRRRWKFAATAVVAAALAVVVAMPLLDESFDELVAWGDEELASGKPSVAAQIYTRALAKATESDKPRIAERIVRTCRNLEDPQEAVDLALRVIDLTPDASFRPHDYLVAQALVTRERARSPSGTIDIWHDKPSPALELVKARLELALADKLDAKQRMEVEETLAAIDVVLSAVNPWAGRQPEFLHTLPTGPLDKLQAMLDDASQTTWDRARSAIAIGKLHEQDARPQDALAAYRRAYDWIRVIYPMLGGVKAGTAAQGSRVDAPDAKECLLVRELVDSIRRLAPEETPEPTGRVEFDVLGFTLPPEIDIDLSLELCDPSIDNPSQGLPHNLPRLVPLRQDAPVSVQVLDGVYRLTHRGHHSRWQDKAERLARLVQVDVVDWPNEIEVRGNTVKLPPIQLRVADELALISPANGATLNLAETVLRWRSVPGASRYEAQLLYLTETPSPSRSYFLTVSTNSPQLRVAELAEFEKSRVRENLTAGRTGGWRVDAFDEAGRRIGVSLVENHFLVAGPLAAP